MASSNKNQIAREIRKQVELQGEKELRRELKREVEEIRDDAKKIALADMDAGYATGEFVESIKSRMRRPRNRLPSGQVYSNDPKAHLLEYGTEDTPEYGTFAKVAHRHGGTPGGEGENIW